MLCLCGAILTLETCHFPDFSCFLWVFLPLFLSISHLLLSIPRQPVLAWRFKRILSNQPLPIIPVVLAWQCIFQDVLPILPCLHVPHLRQTASFGPSLPCPGPEGECERREIESSWRRRGIWRDVPSKPFSERCVCSHTLLKSTLAVTGPHQSLRELHARLQQFSSLRSLFLLTKIMQQDEILPFRWGSIITGR